VVSRLLNVFTEKSLANYTMKTKQALLFRLLSKSSSNYTKHIFTG